MKIQMQSGFGGPEREADLFTLLKALLAAKIPHILSADNVRPLFDEVAEREDFALRVFGRKMEGDNGICACWSSRQRQYARDLFHDLGRFLFEQCELRLKDPRTLSEELARVLLASEPGGSPES